jgi:hypothetical protein
MMNASPLVLVAAGLALFLTAALQDLVCMRVVADAGPAVDAAGGREPARPCRGSGDGTGGRPG